MNQNCQQSVPADDIIFTSLQSENRRGTCVMSESVQGKLCSFFQGTSVLVGRVIDRQQWLFIFGCLSRHFIKNEQNEPLTFRKPNDEIYCNKT